MDIDTPEAKAFLFELYTMTGGNVDEQVSMYDVGSHLGLEKSEAGTLAEGLFIQGYAELKTLSGGIGITVQGLELLDIKPSVSPEDSQLALGDAPILQPEKCHGVSQLLQDIKEQVPAMTADDTRLKELTVDIKTIEIQLTSPAPKTRIIKEALRSLQMNLTQTTLTDLAARLAAVAGI